MIVIYVSTFNLTRYVFDDGDHVYDVQRIHQFEPEVDILINRCRGELLTVIAYGKTERTDYLLEVWPDTIVVDGCKPGMWLEECLDLPARRVKEAARLCPEEIAAE